MAETDAVRSLFRGRRARTMFSAHSTGIGLWTVRFIVRDSGGSIAVEEAPVDGTVVRLRLPIAET